MLLFGGADRQDDSGLLWFQYGSAWLHRPEAMPLSRSLQVTDVRSAAIDTAASDRVADIINKRATLFLRIEKGTQ